MADLGILHPEAARFEIREHRFNPPPGSIIQRRQIAGLFRHGDDPRAMIQGSAWPGSWMIPMWVRARWPVRSTSSKENSFSPAQAPVVVFPVLSKTTRLPFR